MGACDPKDVLVSRTVVGLDTTKPSASHSEAMKLGETQVLNSQTVVSNMSGQEDDLSALLDLLTRQQ